ncbi:SDR family oxidoreductase [Actinokineospora auranticolor]|uniref:3-oxoacyl-[acyl-carrier protein] reductase n=1 Tax=Actinokineospora auranticolor TaxID=155976 RepID=A0A2S6GXG5_9PSEU|nr:SDR family oxidoreductase [Actinokineospora auranticolor]PPK69877.1 3-oxoacyl-[acyl-carrier protein] reductase [Actinokineospora auranticolor]
MRTVVVSGGGTGIGRAVAERVVATGDRAVIVGRRPEVLAAAAEEIGAEAIAADLAEPDEVTRLSAEIARRYERVDGIVAAAGGNALRQHTPPEGLAGVAWTWTENFRLNTLTAALLVEGLREHIADNGRVVLVSSIAAHRGSGSGSYAGAKAALHPYAYDLASALGPKGITVNVVAPGYIAETEFFGDTLTTEREQTLIAQTSNKRVGTPSDVADTVSWLLSPGAGHVTAQIVQVNGGAGLGR